MRAVPADPGLAEEHRAAVVRLDAQSGERSSGLKAKISDEEPTMSKARLAPALASVARGGSRS